MRYLSALALACVLAVVSACAPTPGVGRASAVAVQLAPCATEDSDNCVWLASECGNGLGESFTVRNGVVLYLSE